MCINHYLGVDDLDGVLTILVKIELDIPLDWFVGLDECLGGIDFLVLDSLSGGEQ